MSIQAVSVVLELPGDLVTPIQRLVLISLANHANKEGRNSYPSRNTIAEETGLSERTITDALGRLKGMGLLMVARYPGRDADGHYMGSFVYDIHIPGLSTPLAPDAMGRGSTHSETPSESRYVTDEPKKKKSSRKTKSYPQDIGSVMREMQQ